MDVDLSEAACGFVRSYIQICHNLKNIVIGCIWIVQQLHMGLLKVKFRFAAIFTWICHHLYKDLLLGLCVFLHSLLGICRQDQVNLSTSSMQVFHKLHVNFYLYLCGFFTIFMLTCQQKQVIIVVICDFILIIISERISVHQRNPYFCSLCFFCFIHLPSLPYIPSLHDQPKSTYIK